MKIAVIGAGLAGLAAATELRAAGHGVVLWEKSRGVGGRTATRRGPQGMRFDHGAPFLHDGAAPLGGLAGLKEHELLTPDGSRRSEVVGDPSANAPAKRCAEGLDVRTGVRVGRIERDGGAWSLTDERGEALERADVVLVTVPAPQAETLLRGPSPALADRAGGVAFDPCWTVMAAWDRPLKLPFTAAAGQNGLTWAVAEAPKPGRAAGERWVLHANAELSTELIEADASEVSRALLQRFSALAGDVIATPQHQAAHRWRYARPSSPLEVSFIQDGTLLAAGDWCGGDSAGAAVRSGRAAAAALLS